jgi:hypothetical protein
VVTTPRRPQYWRGTVDAIDAAGGRSFTGRKVIFVDGAADVSHNPDGWEFESLTNNEPSRGTCRSFWEIFHRAALAGTPELLFFEDDVRFARNAITAMSAYQVPPNLGALSFLNMNPGMAGRGPGVHRYTGRHFWGSQALKLPARALERFTRTDNIPTGYPHAGDVWIGHRFRIGIVIPALVRHIGAKSSIPCQADHTLEGPHAHRAGLDYAGDDFDALGILPAAHASSKVL